MKRTLARTRRPHEWLDLLDLTGIIVTEPVLEEHWPEGPPDLPRADLEAFRRRAVRYDEARAEHAQLLERGKAAPKPRAAIRAWIDFVLEDLLQHPRQAWAKAGDVPAECRAMLSSVDQELRADRVLVHAGKPVLLVSLVEPDQELGRADRADHRWKASPATKLERLLRETGHELGLVTNGTEWRLLFCPPGTSTGAIGWTSRRLVEERSVLRALVLLLGRDVLRAPSGSPSLLELCRTSRERQANVAGQLGRQVREGIELLLRALDESDRRAQGRLLEGMTDAQVYEMLLTVMMRLVFLLYAEERKLLPHGDVLYDRAYGVTHLWRELREREHLDEGHDAWDRFLATCRLVHGGCDHPDMIMRPYGGLLFDPSRWPALERPECGVPNAAMLAILDRLLFARQRKGGDRQRVGYWAIDVEQIGYLYEGLLDHRVARAGDDVMVKLEGAGEEALPLAELERRSGKELAAFVGERLGKTKDKDLARLAERLAAEPDEDVQRKLALLPPAVAERVRPFASVVQCHEVAPPGHRFLTIGTSRRASGTQYTPQALTESVVRHALEPLVYRCEEGKPGRYVLDAGGARIVRSPRELLDLKIADIAMGSGAFLVQVVRYLSERLMDAWDRASTEAPDGALLTLPHAEPQAHAAKEDLIPFDDRDAMRLWARRHVANRCVYGVDVNPLAVDLAKLSLWIVTLRKDLPFTFVDHALKCGDSLVGVSREQFIRWSVSAASTSSESASGDETIAPFEPEFLTRALAEATAAREEIEQNPVIEIEDTEAKSSALRRADAAAEALRIAGDLLVAPSFAGVKAAEEARLRKAAAYDLASALKDGSASELHERTWASLPLVAGVPLKPFHWFVEFPEVFARGGFDCIVGNPPFMLGSSLTGTFGKPYREWLVSARANGLRGNANLCAYFWRRSAELLHQNGMCGLVGPKAMAEGDSHEVGLAALPWHIHFAITALDWPGDASIRVCLLAAAQASWAGAHELDGRHVAGITSRLTEGTRTLERHNLIGVPKLAFNGTKVYGEGFVLSINDAEHLLRLEPQSSAVVLPFICSDDLRTRVPARASRRVIDFFEMSLAEASKYPRALEHVRQTVKPLRDKQSRPALRDRWWQHGEKRPGLRRAMQGIDSMLAICSVSKHHIVYRTGLSLFDHNIVVFPTPSRALFALLQSSVHEYFARNFSSGTTVTPGYRPSDCFECFPLPWLDVEKGLLDASLAEVGELYETVRSDACIQRQIGPTTLLDLFHDRAERSTDMLRLRELHVEIDLAVLAAYGWSALPLDHGFHSTKEGLRFTVSEAARRALLDRLLSLNQERHASELAAGLHEMRKARPLNGGRKRRASHMGLSESQPSLIDEGTPYDE